MTATRIVHLDCDGLPTDPNGCPTASELDTEYEWEQEARQDAAAYDGWEHEDGRDLCAGCVLRAEDKKDGYGEPIPCRYCGKTMDGPDAAHVCTSADRARHLTDSINASLARTNSIVEAHRAGCGDVLDINGLTTVCHLPRKHDGLHSDGHGMWDDEAAPAVTA